jgi:hypothetical protein
MEDKMKNKSNGKRERLLLTEKEIRHNLFVSQSQGWARPSRLLTSDELIQRIPASMPSLFDRNGDGDE